MNDSPALTIRNLTVTYGERTVVHDVHLFVPLGTCTAIVGESGSGKTTTGRAIADLLPHGATHTGIINTPHPVAYMPQDAVSALNPLRTVHWQLERVLKHRGVPRPERKSRAAALLQDAGITNPSDVLTKYPHELSGGLAQRVILATVLATEPRALIADEPTSALDVSTQAVVLNMFRTLVDDTGIALAIITHDLRAAVKLADNIAVMHRGRIVETGTPETIWQSPRHDYTRALVGASTIRTE